MFILVPAPLQATNTPEGHGEIECCSGTPSSVAVFIDNPIVSQRFVLNRLQQFTILNLCGEGSDVLVRQAHHKSIALALNDSETRVRKKRYNKNVMKKLQYCIYGACQSQRS